VALRLLPQRFDLGFCALHAFCPAQTARIFAAVASKLAGQGRTAELRSLLQNIQGTVTSDEWDQACLNRLQLCWMFFMSYTPCCTCLAEQMTKSVADHVLLHYCTQLCLQPPQHKRYAGHVVCA